MSALIRMPTATSITKIASTITMIVGAAMPPGLAATMIDPRVQLLGHVDDLSEIYGQVRLAVAPLRSGAGIKGKVLVPDLVLA